MEKNNEIKISVIVPVYNVERYLEKCIRSIMKQNLEDIEIICINDGSTDNSLYILKKLANEDNRIIIVNKKNEGVAETRNLGIKLAKGKYIQYIDSDDYLEEKYLKKAYEISEKLKLDILIFDYYINTANNILKKNDIFLKNNVIITGKEYLNILFDMSNKTKSTFIWNKLVKRDLYIKNNIFIPVGLNLGEDVYTLTLLSYYARKIGKYNSRYYHYIINMNSMSNTHVSLRLDNIVYLFEKLSEFFINKKEINITKEILDKNEFKHLFKIIYLESHFEKQKYTKTVLRFLELIKNLDNDILKNEKFILRIAVFILKKYPILPSFKIINKILIFFRKLNWKLKRKK